MPGSSCGGEARRGEAWGLNKYEQVLGAKNRKMSVRRRDGSRCLGSCMARFLFDSASYAPMHLCGVEK